MQQANNKLLPKDLSHTDSDNFSREPMLSVMARLVHSLFSGHSLRLNNLSKV